MTLIKLRNDDSLRNNGKIKKLKHLGLNESKKKLIFHIDRAVEEYYVSF